MKSSTLESFGCVESIRPFLDDRLAGTCYEDCVIGTLSRIARDKAACAEPGKGFGKRPGSLPLVAAELLRFPNVVHLIPSLRVDKVSQHDQSELIDGQLECRSLRELNRQLQSGPHKSSIQAERAFPPQFYASRAQATSSSQVRSRPRRLRRSARVPKTRAGLEAKACGKLRPEGAARLDADTTAPAPPCHAKTRAICGPFTGRIHRVHGGWLRVYSKSRKTQARQLRQGPCGETLSRCLLRPFSGLFLRVLRRAHCQVGGRYSVPGSVRNGALRDARASPALTAPLVAMRTGQLLRFIGIGWSSRHSDGIRPIGGNGNGPGGSASPEASSSRPMPCGLALPPLRRDDSSRVRGLPVRRESGKL